MSAHRIGTPGAIPMLDAADRLVRFWNRHWTAIGHVFTDLPAQDEIDPDGVLAVSIPHTHPLAHILLGDGTQLDQPHMTIPRTPRAWAITRIDLREQDVLVRAINLDAHIQQNTISDQKFVERLRDTGEIR